MPTEANTGYIDPISGSQGLESPTQDRPAENDENTKDLNLLLTCLDRGKKSREPHDKDWNKYIQYYDGNQWYGNERPGYKASPVANLIFPTIQTILPIMTDTHPGIDVIPGEPTDFDFADVLSKVIRSWWEKRGAQQVLIEGLMDALRLSGGIFKIPWDGELEHGEGDVQIVSIDPFNFYISEGATDCNQNCQWCIEYYPATVGELKEKYPDKASDIRATGKRKQENDDEDKTKVVVVSPTDKDMGPWPNIGGDSPQGSPNDQDVVWVAEMWIDDWAVEEIEIEKEDGTTEVQRKRTYPNGKVIAAVPDLKLHLETAPNPYKDGKKPYVRVVDYITPRSFWGEGEIKHVVETQDLINKTLATIYDYTNLAVNPCWILDDDSGVDPDMITNQVGLIIQKQRGSEVRREGSPPLAPQVFEFYNMMRELYDTQTGVHDITQGRKPVGITAAEAINTMQEAAQTRIRLKERNMNVALAQIGRLVISRILQFYKTPRVIKISGAKKWPEWFEFYVEDIQGEGNEPKYRSNQREWKYNEDEKKPVAGNWKQSGESKGVFDIDVVSGTSLPFMKAQRGELALRLATMQMIDQDSLLETLDWPNKEETMRRMQEAAQAQAEAQAQQAGGPPGPPPR